MYVNPFERMKKKREETERQKLETDREREKYAKLGVQMGLSNDNNNGVVPSFMQNLMGEDKQSNVPPFGMSMDQGDSFAPMPSSPSPKKNNSNTNLKDLVLPGGAGSGGDNSKRETSPIPPSSMGMEQSVPPLAPSAPSAIPGMPASTGFEDNLMREMENDRLAQQEPVEHASFPKNDNFPADDVFNNAAEPGNPFSQEFDGVNPQIDSMVTTDEFDNMFNELSSMQSNDQYQGINTVSQQAYNSIDEIDNQFIAVVGDRKAAHDVVEELINNSSSTYNVRINVKNLGLYSSPILFFVKQVITALPEQIGEEDRNTLWERVSLMLSVVDGAQTGTEIDTVLENQLILGDPISLINREFHDILEAYNITSQINVALQDFRGVELNDINKLISLVEGIFTNTNNFKFLFEINEDLLQTFLSGKGVNSWLKNFDEVIDINNDYNDGSGGDDEDFFGLDDDEGAPPSAPVSFEQPKEHMSPDDFTNNLPEEDFASPFDDLAPPSAPFGSPSSSPMVDENPPNLPGSGGGFPMPTIGGSTRPEEHTAVQEVTQEDVSEEEDANPIRIRIDLNMQRHEEEKRMQELEEEQIKRDQDRTISGFDPSILMDGGVTEDTSGTNIFANFNAKSFLSGQEGGNTTPVSNIENNGNTIKDDRSYDQIKDKLEDLRDDLSSKSTIDIQSNRDRKDNPNGHQIPVPGNWTELK